MGICDGLREAYQQSTKEDGMSEPTRITEIPHERLGSFIDEHVDKYSAYSIQWNGEAAVHLTFGRDSLRLGTTRLVHFDDAPAQDDSGRLEVVRLDVAAISMPLATAKRLSETLARMIKGLEGEADE